MINRADFALAADKELCERSLYHFIKGAWHVLEPATPFIGGWHIEALCEHLEAVTKGQVHNLLINISPRCSKTIVTCVFWPMWEWIKRPHYRYLCSTYSERLSITSSQKARELINSSWYRKRWGSNFFLLDDQNQKLKFENNHKGFRFATSTGGMVTGEGGNRIIVDDPHNVVEIDSDVIMQKVRDWWDSSMFNRLNDPINGARVIIMQRLRENDLSGYLLERGLIDCHLCIPYEYEAARHCTTSIGWTDPRSIEGELMTPSRFDANVIRQYKLVLQGQYPGQYQQTPTASGGGAFKEAYFRYFKEEQGFYRLFNSKGQITTVNKNECWYFACMDPAGVDKENSVKACYTVVQVFAVTPEADMLLLEQYREQVETPDATVNAARLCRQYEVDFIGVEKNGIGLGIIATLSRMGIGVVSINAKRDKVERSSVAQIRMSAGKVFFLKDGTYTQDIKHELLLFPNGKFLDQVDTLSHACKVVQDRHGVPDVLTADMNETQQFADISPIPDNRFRRAF